MKAVTVGHDRRILSLVTACHGRQLQGNSFPLLLILLDNIREEFSFQISIPRIHVVLVTQLQLGNWDVSYHCSRKIGNIGG